MTNEWQSDKSGDFHSYFFAYDTFEGGSINVSYEIIKNTFFKDHFMNPGM